MSLLSQSLPPTITNSIHFSSGQDSKPHFTNPAAIQRAAAVLGTTQEELTEIIFAPPPVNQFTIRMRNKSDSLSPPSSAEATPERQARSVAASYIEALEGFAIGLYQEAFSALMKLINRLVWLYFIIATMVDWNGRNTV